MEVYEPLPFNLKCSFKDGIQPAIRQQLDFLWRGAHAVSSSTSLARSLGKKFIDLGIKSGLHIPEQVRNRLCSFCSGILLPSITSIVRVQSRGKESKVHRKKNLIPRGDGNGDDDAEHVTVFDSKIRRKLKNQVITTCTLCSHISRVVSGCEIIHKVQPIKTTISTVSKDLKAIDDVIKSNNEAAIIAAQNSSKKFSFLQKNDRRSSAPGRMAEDFIPLSSSNGSLSSLVPAKNGSSFFQKAKITAVTRNNGIMSGDNDNGAPLTAELSLKLGIVSTEDDDLAPLSGQKRQLTLVELEQMNKKDKKARRKTIEMKNSTPNKRAGIIPKVGYEISTTGSASLSSLQNIFKLK